MHAQPPCAPESVENMVLEIAQFACVLEVLRWDQFAGVIIVRNLIVLFLFGVCVYIYIYIYIYIYMIRGP